jgi:TrmH family RNA methyltransferase
MPAAREYLELTSTANPRVKALLGLRRRRTREDLQLTVIEGYEELVLALDSGVVPETLYYCPALITDDRRGELVGRVVELDSEIFKLSKNVFEHVAYRESPDGWLAVVPAVSTRLADLEVRPDSLFLVCESVEKPGNLGAMLRTADAAGVDAVISSQPVTDWGNPNVVRASKGTVFTVPVVTASSSEVLQWLEENSISIVATTPHTTVDFTDVDLTGSRAIAVGSEKYGLSEQWLARASERVRIPMLGKVNSLNVATSAAIVVYEAVRQRRVEKTS